MENEDCVINVPKITTTFFQGTSCYQYDLMIRIVYFLSGIFYQSPFSIYLFNDLYTVNDWAIKWKTLQSFPRVIHFICLDYYFTLLRVFYTWVTSWFFTEVWVTASLLKSPGFFSLFWPISTMQSFGWSPFILLFPSPPILVTILWWLYQAHQLHLVWLSLSCSIVFSVL